MTHAQVEQQAAPENKKYELLTTDTMKSWDGRTLYRIRALAAIAAIGVAAGDLGGYVEAETNLQVSGDAWVYGNARVFGDARVYGNARVYGDARVSLNIHFGWMVHVGSENGTLTWYRAAAGIQVNRGCFYGTLDEFESAVSKTHGDNQSAKEYRCLIDFIKLRSSSWVNEEAKQEAA